MPDHRPPTTTGDSLTPHLSRTATLIHAHLQQHGPTNVRTLQASCGPETAQAIQELKAHWLVFHPQGNGTRAQRYGELRLTPRGRPFSQAELLAMHAQVQGQRGTLAHFQRRLHLSAGDTLAALRALVSAGLASGEVIGATVACQVQAHQSWPEDQAKEPRQVRSAAPDLSPPAQRHALAHAP